MIRDRDADEGVVLRVVEAARRLGVTVLYVGALMVEYRGFEGRVCAARIDRFIYRGNKHAAT